MKRDVEIVIEIGLWMLCVAMGLGILWFAYFWG